MQDDFEKFSHIPPEKLQKLEENLKKVEETKKNLEAFKEEHKESANIHLIERQIIQQEELISELTDIILALHVDIDMETFTKKEKVAQKQISYFLEKCGLSDDLIKPSRKK